MARIKVTLPQSKPIFTTKIQVRVDDMNYGNHMGNEVALKFFHEARLRFLKSKNSSELNLLNHSLIMADAAISYKNESFQGDEISITVYVADFHKYGFDFFYKMTRAEDEVARGKTGMLFFNYDHRKLIHAPDNLEKFLSN